MCAEVCEELEIGDEPTGVALPIVVGGVFSTTALVAFIPYVMILRVRVSWNAHFFWASLLFHARLGDK
jgi:hypothetical protein